jgi:hypothetical protein
MRSPKAARSADSKVSSLVLIVSFCPRLVVQMPYLAP